MHWVLLCVLVSVPGFLFNCQPSEPYLTRYLEETKNLTGAAVNRYVWPADTYASLAFLLPTGFFAELLGYLPVVIFGALLREATRVLLIWGQGLTPMILMQVTYAGGVAAQAVYFSLPYLYLMGSTADDSERRDFQFAVVTAIQHAAYHAGNIVGSALGQGLIVKGVPMRVLFYISWGATSLSVVFLVALCFVKTTRRRVMSIRVSELRNTLSKTSPRIVAATFVLCFFGASWAILSNYFQQNLKDSGLPKADYGYLEMALELVFILASLPAFALKSSHHGAAINGCILLGGISSALIFCISQLTLSWRVALVLNLVALFCQRLAVQLSTTIIAQTLTQHYAIVFAATSFVGLVLATIATQIAVAVGFSSSAQFYLLAGVLGVPEVLSVLVCQILMCRVPVTGKTKMEEMPILAEEPEEVKTL